MSGRPRKRELDDYSPIVHGNEKTKMRREDRHGQASATDQRIIYMEEITKLRWLVYDYVPLKDRAKFEEELDKIGSDDRIVTRQTSNIQNLNHVMENDAVTSPQHVDSLRLNLLPPEAYAQSAATINLEDHSIESIPYIQNLPTAGDVCMSSSAVIVEPSELPASGDGLLSSSDVTVQPLQFSNQLKLVAQINFNAELLKKLCDPHNRSKAVVKELCGMIKQRTTLIKSAQYEYSLIDQHQFNQVLVTKLRGLEHVAPDMKVVFRKLVDTLQWDALDPGQVLCPCYRYLYDIDLLKYIASNCDTVPAQHILRSRNLRLKHLSFESKSGDIELKLDSSQLLDTVGGIACPTYRKFQYGVQDNTIDAVYIFGLFNLVLQFYEVSQASISLKHFGPTSVIYYHALERTIGTPPRNQIGKIRIKEMTVESPEMMDFLRWLHPTKLIICCDPGILLETPSLIAGVNVIQCRRIHADQLIENCKSEKIRLDGGATWSEESFFRTLTAHSLSTDSYPSRQIAYHCQGTDKTIKDWKALFRRWSHWSKFYAADSIKNGRKVTMHENGIDYITLTLL